MSPQLVVLVAVAVLVLAYPLLRLWVSSGHLLPVGAWSGVVLLLFMAVGVYCAGLPVRRMLRGTARMPIDPLRALRTLVLAQSGALTGAAVVGWSLAQVLVLLPNLDVPSVRSQAVVTSAHALAGVLLAVAGLLAQRMCRLGEDQTGREDDDER